MYSCDGDISMLEYIHVCRTYARCTHVHTYTHTWSYIIHTPVLSHSLRVLNAPTANSSPNEQYAQWKRMQCVVSHLTAISYTSSEIASLVSRPPPSSLQ